MLRSRRIVANC